jgi:AcrR family transcriptional regulator
MVGTMNRRLRPGRRRDAEVDAALVKAALAEITEKGLGGTTMERIADRAGVGRATLYRRCSNKVELVRYLASQLISEYEPADTGDLRKDLLSVFGPSVDQLRDGEPIAVLMPMFVAEAAHDEQIREFVTSMTAERQAHAVTALRRARRRGELRDDVHIETVVDMIAGAFSHRVLLLGEHVTMQFVRKVVDLAIDGIVA